MEFLIQLALVGLIGILAAVLFILGIVALVKWTTPTPKRKTVWKQPRYVFESANRAAGRHGEEAVSKVIETVLKDGDNLLTNVQIMAAGKPAEMDCVVVNRNGVFIFEVKNYKGVLEGREDDYEWHKYKTTPGGDTYHTMVRNPIKQVKRQVYVCKEYLLDHGHRVWVDGYAILVNENCPVRSDLVLTRVSDIDRVIHSRGRNNLSEKQVGEIVRALKHH